MDSKITSIEFEAKWNAQRGNEFLSYEICFRFFAPIFTKLSSVKTVIDYVVIRAHKKSEANWENAGQYINEMSSILEDEPTHEIYHEKPIQPTPCCIQFTNPLLYKLV